MSCMRNGFVSGALLDGRFEALSPLNHGSFGMVFLARDSSTDELVAVKCLAKPSISDPSANANGNDHLVELACHARLGFHPNVVNLIHAFETDAHMYLVLEFCSMGDLYEAIRVGRGPLETEHVRDFMLQLVGAVEFMHAKGLYHRDIKPENIFLAQDGSVKLGDFGLSTTEDWTLEACVGSDRYMSPEQYDPADVGYCPARADIWAVGICLLNVLFSRNPFVAPSESDPLYADFARDRRSLFDVFPSMSQDTFDVLDHALTVDPSRRSLAGLREALGRVLTFTAQDDVLDDFCTEDRELVPASANRQPLRTPSVQSSATEQAATFPWTGRVPDLSPARPLSVIPDAEEGEDDLFPVPRTVPAAGRVAVDGDVGPASLASIIDSTLGASVRSMNLREPKPRNLPRPAPAPAAGSLPVTASRPIRALSSFIFGRKDGGVSKSWSDLWDEEEEEQQEEEEEDARRRLNARNWSGDDDALDEDDAAAVGRSAPPSGATKSVAVPGSRSRSPVAPQMGVFVDSSSEDVSSFEDHPAAPIYRLPAYSPPARRSVMDKWAALGNRRRAFVSASDLDEEEAPPSGATKRRRNAGGESSWRRGLTMKVSTGNAGAVVPATSGPTASFDARFGGTGGVWGSRRKDVRGEDEAPTRERRGDRQLVHRHLRHHHAHPRHLHLLHRDVDDGGPHPDDADDADVEWVGGWHDLHL